MEVDSYLLGDVWDLTGVKDEVEKHTKQGIEGGHMLRTFVLGVGDGVAVGMCEEIATAGNGVAIFVGVSTSSLEPP